MDPPKRQICNYVWILTNSCPKKILDPKKILAQNCILANFGQQKKFSPAFQGGTGQLSEKLPQVLIVCHVDMPLLQQRHGLGSEKVIRAASGCHTCMILCTNEKQVAQFSTTGKQKTRQNPAGGQGVPNGQRCLHDTF